MTFQPHSISEDTWGYYLQLNKPYEEEQDFVILSSLSWNPQITDRMCTPHHQQPNLYVEILTPNMIILRGGDFGKWLGHEGGGFGNGISGLLRREMERFIIFFAMWGYNQKTAICESLRRALTMNLSKLAPWSCAASL